MKVTVHDIATFEREVELPEKCPHCGYKVGVDGSKLVSVNYQCQKDVVDIYDGEVNYDTVPSVCDGYYNAEWRCPECTGILAAGKELSA
jgi:hypothetical protein